MFKDFIRPLPLMMSAVVAISLVGMFLIIMQALNRPSSSVEFLPANEHVPMERLRINGRDAWYLNRAVWKMGDDAEELCWMSVDQNEHGTVAVAMIDCEKVKRIIKIQKATTVNAN
ncbi:MAG: hypothetical protein NTX72_03960 [Candidatus Uhrbacteria bacterium]|nr:hypothetical protein [Candidatus Uhrbacteria bacterium]